MRARFYNRRLDLIVKVTGEEFVIIGEESLVSDDELLAMIDGRAPEGWARLV